MKKNLAKKQKISKIIPLDKKSDRTNGENYHPVSNIVFICQICERAVYDQVFDHFCKHHLFHPNNHGFRPNHSTATALIQGGKAAPLFSGWEPPKILYGGWQLMI